MKRRTCRRQDCTEPAEVEDFTGAPAWCEFHGARLAQVQEDQAEARRQAALADRRADGARYAAEHLGRPWTG